MTPPEPSATLLGLKNISVENMARRNGSARSVRRNTRFNLIGKLTRKLAEPGSTNVTVEHSFPGYPTIQDFFFFSSFVFLLILNAHVEAFMDFLSHLMLWND